jgi:hypothetical protein
VTVRLAAQSLLQAANNAKRGVEILRHRTDGITTGRVLPIEDRAMTLDR